MQMGGNQENMHMEKRSDECDEYEYGRAVG